MTCLVCGKGIPLLRQLRGSSFCSHAHSQEYAARKNGPPAAEFAPSPPDLAPQEARADTTIPDPIPRFNDVLLTRQRSRVRDGMGVKGAHNVIGLPQPAIPAPSRAIGETSPASATTQLQFLQRAALSPGAPVPPRGLSSAGLAETLTGPSATPVNL